MAAVGKLPYNGQQILELRQNGKRPADMVLVSLIGWLGEQNPCVLAKPGRRYEWGFLADLDVLVVANSEVGRDDVRAVVSAVLESRPAYLGLWMADKQDGFNVAWGRYRPSQRRGAGRMGHYEKQRFSGLGVNKK